MSVIDVETYMHHSDRFYNYAFSQINGCGRLTLLGIKDEPFFDLFVAKNGGEAPTIDNRVEVIADGVFKNKGNVSSITFPEQLMIIGARAFEHSGLRGVDFSTCKNLKIIKERAFYDICASGVLDLTPCQRLFAIEKYAFGVNDFDEVRLPRTTIFTVKCEGAFSKRNGGNTACTKPVDEEEQMRLF